mgnify:CR=1 FL=1
MSNPCIGPNDMRYAFVVRKSGELWVSRRLFVLSKIDDVDLMGQYLRDMWYMETLCPDDIREFMIIPINSITRLGEIARTLKSCSNTMPCSDLLNIVRDKYDVEWIYNFELSKHAIQKYISDDKPVEIKQEPECKEEKPTLSHFIFLYFSLIFFNFLYITQILPYRCIDSIDKPLLGFC